MIYKIDDKTINENHIGRWYKAKTVDNKNDIFLLYDFCQGKLNPIKYVIFDVSNKKMEFRSCCEFVYIDDNQDEIRRRLFKEFNIIYIFDSIFLWPNYVE